MKGRLGRLGVKENCELLGWNRWRQLKIITEHNNEDSVITMRAHKDKPQKDPSENTLSGKSFEIPEETENIMDSERAGTSKEQVNLLRRKPRFP